LPPAPDRNEGLSQSHGQHRTESLSVVAGKFNGANAYSVLSSHSPQMREPHDHQRSITASREPVSGADCWNVRIGVAINKLGTFDEGENRYPNAIEVRIHVPDPRNNVTTVDE
jgi:hypothetical protein